MNSNVFHLFKRRTPNEKHPLYRFRASIMNHFNLLNLLSQKNKCTVIKFDNYGITFNAGSSLIENHCIRSEFEKDELLQLSFLCRKNKK